MEKLQEILTGLLDDRPQSLRVVHGGPNSVVYEVRTAKGGHYAVKQYKRSTARRWDRLSRELAGLDFLWAQGLRGIPQPLARDAENRVAVYPFLRGEPVAPNAHGVQQAIDFLVTLQAFRGQAQAIGEASEACFSLHDHFALVDGRLGKLRNAVHSASHGLDEWLERDALPFLNALQEWTAERTDTHATLPAAQRILSPSDFGFHNMLRGADGQLLVLDFEYFGWDDPAKTISDFFNQPAVPVPPDLHQSVLRRLQDSGEPFDEPTLPRRLALLHPLLGLKWCLILLNPFHLEQVDETVLRRRLEEAAVRLRAVREAWQRRDFPMRVAQQESLD